MSRILKILKENTNATLFFMPIFGIDDKTLKKIGFINAYTQDKDKAYEENGIYKIHALFRPDTNGFADFKTITKKLEAAGILYDEYDYEDGYIVLALNFPERFNEDYDHIMNGKYTKVSRELVKKYPEKTIKMKSGKRIEDYTIQYHIFNRTPGMRGFIQEELGIDEIKREDKEFEYWTLPGEGEILDIEKHLKKLPDESEV